LKFNNTQDVRIGQHWTVQTTPMGQKLCSVHIHV